MDVYHKDQTIRLQCNRKKAILAGVQFREYDLIEIVMNKDADVSEAQGSGGAWGWGGYSASYIKSIAASIKDLQSGITIWERT